MRNRQNLRGEKDIRFHVRIVYPNREKVIPLGLRPSNKEYLFIYDLYRQTSSARRYRGVELVGSIPLQMEAMGERG